MKTARTWLAGLALLFGPGSPLALSGQELTADDKPNIVIIVADDMGYSDLGCYGGEIRTPNIDRLALNGLRFTNFYNSGRCWPTRSSLLSGYYATAIGMDPIRPQKPCPSWVKTIPQYLGEAGYKTYHSGKYHFFNKPLPVKDGGFDRSYWTEGDCFSATQCLDDLPMEKHTSKDGKILTTSIADHAIGFLQDHQKDETGRPFFLYLAYHAPHFPLMALEEDVAKYRDRYRKGWDALKKERWQRMKKEGLVKHAPPPAEVGINQTYAHLMPDGILLDSLGSGEVLFPVPWESLNAEQKEFQSMKMAIHAAMVDRVDQETGRVLDQIASMGTLENTVIFFLSDNGASAEMMIRGNGHDPAKRPGADSTYLCLGPGWANASNTPFRRYKSWTHEGGTATPLIVHWPGVIREKGALRDDPGHVVDLLPTLLELSGLEQADSWQGSEVPELHGKSLLPAFAANGSVKRDYLYFHHYGLFEADAHNRALRMGQWKIVSSGTDGDRWELYNLEADRGEQNDLSLEKPFLLDIMVRKWEKADSECNQLSSKESINN